MILIVEDDHLVRELLRDFLESAGYRVVDASSAEEALRAAADGALGLSVLVTDMELPGIDGAELARQLRTTRPALRVLYVSGNPVGSTEGATGDSGVASLGKPFTREMLIEKVRGLLAIGA